MRRSLSVTALPSPGMVSGMPITSRRASSSACTSSRSIKLPSTSICLDRRARCHMAPTSSTSARSSSTRMASRGFLSATRASICAFSTRCMSGSLRSTAVRYCAACSPFVPTPYSASTARMACTTSMSYVLPSLSSERLAMSPKWSRAFCTSASASCAALAACIWINSERLCIAASAVLPAFNAFAASLAARVAAASNLCGLMSLICMAPMVLAA